MRKLLTLIKYYVRVTSNIIHINLTVINDGNERLNLLIKATSHFRLLLNIININERFIDDPN